MTRTPPSSSFPVTRAEGRLTLVVRFNMHQAHIHDVSSVEWGFELGTLRCRSLDFPTKPIRPMIDLRGLKKRILGDRMVGHACIAYVSNDTSYLAKKYQFYF
ncbi:hypothetical protein AVEN_228987-1 [Araneus ventricosus]|uniref:Uncharacterized protein n=1 Tax=Araneus ventricosus TaxID=182803 RepID=A0A4Y2I685_ARAVE|nr:hypothetical protein AVEN_228987-1 [Araneus ventricosus]